MKKTIYSVCSSYDGDDIAAIEIQIEQALKTYLKYVDEYNWGVSYGDSKYAEKTRRPRMEAAKAILDTLNAQKESMESSMGKMQGIDLINEAGFGEADPPAEIPWETIGLAVGALIVIVIIVKLI